MLRLLAVGAATALTLLAAPADGGATRTVTYSVTGCDEVVALARTLAVVTYRCDTLTLGRAPLGPVVVHEVSEVQPDGSFVLLRSVVSQPDLATALSDLGLPVSVSSEARYRAPSGAAGVTTAALTWPGGHLALAALGATATGTGVSVFDGRGASYRYDGRKGRVVLTYQNRFSGHGGGFGGGSAHLDATGDPQLTGWLAASHAVAPVVVTRGEWTGTAVLTRG